jgi:hypothetical protein
MGPTGPAAALAGIQYMLKYPAGDPQRVFASGDRMELNTEITNGAPYIRRDEKTRAFIIAKAGMYIVSLLLNVSAIRSGREAQVVWVLNDEQEIPHSLFSYQTDCSPFLFMDVVQVPAANSWLFLVNRGPDILLSAFTEVASSVSIWGSV